MSTTQCLFGVPAIAAMILGCSAQAEPDYEGEPAATIEGRIVSTMGDATMPLKVALLFPHPVDTDEGLTYGWSAARVDVESHFPADFRLKLYDLSDAQSATEFGSSTPAMIALIPANSGPSVDPNSIVGGAMSFVVHYFPRDGDPHNPNDPLTQEGAYYGFAPTKGFHFFRIEVTTASEAAYFQCAANGLCVRSVPADGTDPLAIKPTSTLNQRFLDAEFARCQKYVPDAEICTMYAEPATDEERQENDRCVELWNTHTPLDTCPGPSEAVPIPAGTTPAITVTFGATMPDIMNARLPL